MYKGVGGGSGNGEGMINRFMLETIEHRSNIGRLVTYSWIELLSKLSVRIIFYENLSLSLSLSLSLCDLSADMLSLLF